MVVKNFWLHKLNKKERLCTSNNFPLITARRRGSSSCLLYLPPANYSYKGGQNTTVFTIRTMISFFTLCSGMLKRGQSLLKREHYPAQISRISLAFSIQITEADKKATKRKVLFVKVTIHCLISSNNIAFNLSSFFVVLPEAKAQNLVLLDLWQQLCWQVSPLLLLGRRLSAKDKALTILMPWSFHSM